MSTAKNILELFQGLRPGQRLSAVEVMNQGAFDVTQAMVYQALASLCQPGKPLQRARNVHGVYEYELRRDVNLKPLLNGPDIDVDTSVPTGEPPAESKTAAAQAPCYSEVNPKATEIGKTPSDRSTSVPPTPARNKRTGEDLGQDDHRVPAQPASAAAPPFLPLDNPNPAQAEVVRFIGELRIRRDALDEVINLLETTFGGPKK